MADEYIINAKITAETSNFEKDVKKAQKSIKNFSNSVKDVIEKIGKNGLVKSMADISLATQGLTKSFSVLINTVKKVGDTVMETSEAFNNQLKAETLLEISAQNNPYLTTESSKRLKEFASEMQKISVIGDERMLPVMSRLASSGRTEIEIQKLIKTALDLSASGMMDFESAVNQLNGTLNGNIGLIGRQVSGLKDLTGEDLKSGKAIDIISEKFKGLSEQTARATGSLQQMKNAQGDFNEAVGKLTKPTADLWNKFWKGWYENGVITINALIDKLDAITIGKKLTSQITQELNNIGVGTKGSIKYVRDSLNLVTDQELRAINNYISSIKKLNSEQELIKKQVLSEIERRKDLSQIEDEYIKLKLKENEIENDIDNNLDSIIEKQNKLLDWQQKRLNSTISYHESAMSLEIERAKQAGKTEKEISEITLKYEKIIHEWKLQALNQEKEEDIKQAKERSASALELLNITSYYKNKEAEINNEYTEIVIKNTKKEVEEIKTTWKDVFQKITNVVKTINKTIAQAFISFAKSLTTITEVTGKVCTSIYNSFSNLFQSVIKLSEMNTSEMLDELLILEDNILTFFISGLPKIAQFVESALSSITSMLDSISESVSAQDFADVFLSIANSVVENIPSMIDNFTLIIDSLINGAITALSQFLETDGLQKLLDSLLSLQQSLENTVVNNLGTLVDSIVEKLPQIMEYLKNSIISASRTLANIAPDLMNLFGEIIIQLIDVLTSQEVIDASIETISSLLESMIADGQFVKIITTFITGVIRIIANIPKLSFYIIQGLFNGIIETDWGEVVYDLFIGFIDGVKALFGIHSPSTVFEEFGKYIVEGFLIGLDPIGTVVLPIFENLKEVLSSLFGGISSVSESIFNNMGNVLIEIVKGFVAILSDLIEGFGNSIKMTFDFIKGLFSDFNNISLSGFIEIIDSVKNSIKEITKLSFTSITKSLNTVFDIFMKISDVSFSNIFELLKLNFTSFVQIINVMKDSLISISKVVFTNINNFTKLNFDGLNQTLNSVRNLLVDISSVTFNGLLNLTRLSFNGVNLGIKAVAESISMITDSVTRLTESITGLVSELNPLSSLTGDSEIDLEDVLKFVDPTGITGDIASGDLEGALIDALVPFAFFRHFFATGVNNAPRGLALVGEQGPELVDFKGGERVYNAQNTKGMLQNVSNSSSNNFNVTFNNLQDTSAYAMIRELKQYNRQMAINGIL